MDRMLAFLFALLFFPYLALAQAYNYPNAIIDMESTRINGNTFFYSNNGQGRVEFNINASKEGYYKISARVLAADGNSDSFYVQIDERFKQYWNIKEDPDVQLRTWNDMLYLSQGEHTVHFWTRENNTKIADLIVDYVSPIDVASSIGFDDEPLHSNWIAAVDSTNIDCDNDGCSWERGELTKIKRDFQTGQNVLEVSYPPTSKGTPRITTKKAFSPIDDEYTLSYRVKFGANYRWARGGKMHGLGPTSPTTGCQPKTDDGWSVRMITQSVGRLALYIYDQDRNNPNGCGEGFTASGFQINELERWYDISIYVKLNSPNEHNGIAKLFVDGVQIHQVENLRLRSTSSTESEIRSLMFNTFYGGGSWAAAPDRTTQVQFSDFQVTRGEVPRNLVVKRVAMNQASKQITQILTDARNIEVPAQRDNGSAANFGNYYDRVRADLDLETGVLDNWSFSNEQRYNVGLLENYAELFLQVSQLFSETTGTVLPKIYLDFHSFDVGGIGFQFDGAPDRSYPRSIDPFYVIIQFLEDLANTTNYRNPSQRNAVYSIDILNQGLQSTFGQLVSRTFSHKTKDTYFDSLKRRAANLYLLEKKHYENYPVGNAYDKAQSTIDLKVDNYGFFEYMPKYAFGNPEHRESGVRSSVEFDQWQFSNDGQHNEILAKAYGQFLIELHDIFRINVGWRGHPTLSIQVMSSNPTKQFQVNDDVWYAFDDSAHPRDTLEQIWNHLLSE